MEETTNDNSDACGQSALTAGLGGGFGSDDELYAQAVALVRKNKRPSISMIQRHLRIGWHRAACMLEAMVGTVIDKCGPDANILPVQKTTPNDDREGRPA